MDFDFFWFVIIHICWQRIKFFFREKCQRCSCNHICPQFLRIKKFFTSDKNLLNRQIIWELLFIGDNWEDLQKDFWTDEIKY